MKSLFALLAAAVLTLPSAAVAQHRFKEKGSVQRDQAMLVVVVIPKKTAPTPEAALAKVSFQGFGRNVEARNEPRAELFFLQEEALSWSGERLSPKERKQLLRVPTVTTVLFTWRPTDRAALAAAYGEALQLNAAFPGWLADGELSMIEPLARWKERAATASAPLDATRHFYVHHSETDDGTVDLDTAGLGRFGLAEVALHGVARSEADSVHRVVNLVAQLLVEGQRPDAAGELRLALDEIGHEGFRASLTDGLFENADREATVRLKKGRGGHAGYTIDFPREYGQSFGERLDRAVSLLFGYEDSLDTVEHTAAIEAASARARAEVIAKFKPKVRKGLPRGEVLMVKAGFPYEDGNEWMWVEVQSWKGEELVGILQNKPELTTAVRAGQKVSVREAEIFDYMYSLSDGSFYGNETGALMKPGAMELLPDGRRRMVER